MHYRPLGRSGLHVSQMCLGAMMFGAWGNDDHDDCVRIVHTALDAGIKFIDTADGYAGGESEQILGKALSGGRRDGVVLAVKFGPPFDADPNHRGASRRWITEGIEGSLRRLGTDYIDLYQVGVPDRLTDTEETLAALTDLQAAGKIRSFGHSKLPPSEIVEAQFASQGNGFGRFRSEQAPYSMLNRAPEYDLLPTCARHGLGVMAFGALASGWLSGRYGTTGEAAVAGAVSGSSHPTRSNRGGRFDAGAPANRAKLEATQALGTLAAEFDLTLVQMATAFVLSHPAVSSAIIGPRTMGHLEGYLAADGVELSPEILDHIDAIVAPGVTINVADTMWAIGSPSLAAEARRRAPGWAGAGASA